MIADRELERFAALDAHLASIDAAAETVDAIRAGEFVAPRKHNALRSLYGAGNQVRAMTGQGERKQEILTPQCVIDGLLRLWPDGVALDPCWAPGSLTNPQHYARVAGVQVPNSKGDAVTVYTPQEGEVDGLAIPWMDQTYTNPPFKLLQEWLRKMMLEDVEQVMLCPIRLQRVWFRQAWRAVDAKIALNPLAFYGHKQGFPQALALLYRGPHVDRFLEAFDGLGGVV